MQLKFRVGEGGPILIDVGPKDTFKDILLKLYQVAGVRLDLNQLKSNNKPMTLSTNVMKYFEFHNKEKLQKGNSISSLHQHQNIQQQHHQLQNIQQHHQIQNLQPQHDQNVLQHLHIASQNLSASNNVPVSEESIMEDKQPEIQLVSRCRLCSSVVSNDPHYMFNLENDETDTLADKVNFALPIHISEYDHLPKQLCSSCFSTLNIVYRFVKRSVDAQEELRKIYSGRARSKFVKHLNECCYLCSSGQMEKKNSVDIPGTSSSNEYYFDDEVVTDYWDGTLLEPLKKKSNPIPPKKRQKEDDNEWTIEEEYIKVRKGKTRGRPTRSKVTVPIVERSCVMCGWLGAISDMYHHSINQHCQPDLNYFPCPLCRSKAVNEAVLENHLAKHITSTVS